MTVSQCQNGGQNDQRFRSKTVCVSLFFLGTFFNYCNFSMIGPFYSIEAEKKGASQTIVGTIFSAFSFSMFVSSLASAKLILKFGAKRVLVVGYGITGICTVIFGFIGFVENVYVFTSLSLLIRTLQGLNVCVAESAIMVLISLMYPENGSYYRGLFEVFIGLGFSLGPVIGGFLYELGGFGMPFYIIGVFSLINVLLIQLFVSYSHSQNSKSKETPLRKLLLLSNTIICSLIGMTAFINLSLVTPNLEIHMRKFNLSGTILGTVFLAEGVTYSIASPLCGWFIDKHKKTWHVMILGLVLQIVTFTFMGPSLLVTFLENSVLLNYITLAMHGAAGALIFVPPYQGILDGAFKVGYENNESTHSAIASIYMCYYSLGETIGPITGALIVDYWNFPTMTTFAVVINILMLTLTVGYLLRKKI